MKKLIYFIGLSTLIFFNNSASASHKHSKGFNLEDLLNPSLPTKSKKRKRPQLSEELLEKLEKLRPLPQKRKISEEALAQHVKAYELFKEGKFEEAKKIIEPLTDRSKKNGYACTLLAEIHRKMAEELDKSALERGCEYARRKRGIELLNQNKSDEALQPLDLALRAFMSRMLAEDSQTEKWKSEEKKCVNIFCLLNQERITLFNEGQSDLALKYAQSLFLNATIMGINLIETAPERAAEHLGNALDLVDLSFFKRFPNYLITTDKIVDKLIMLEKDEDEQGKCENTLTNAQTRFNFLLSENGVGLHLTTITNLRNKILRRYSIPTFLPVLTFNKSSSKHF